MDYYFLEEDGSYFRSTVTFSPYFFVRCKAGSETSVEDFLRKRFENLIESIERVEKEDLEMPNHLSGRKGRFVKLSFRNTVDLAAVRKILQPAVLRNAELAKERGMHSEDSMSFDMETSTLPSSSSMMRRKNSDNYGLNNIVDLREHDLPYHLRVNIDLSIRCGLWYTVTASAGKITIERIVEKNVRPDPVVLAFDIETSKLPLKFPEAQNDPIMMISYMIDGKVLQYYFRHLINSVFIIRATWSLIAILFQRIWTALNTPRMSSIRENSQYSLNRMKRPCCYASLHTFKWFVQQFT